jgi:hypothetical protein
METTPHSASNCRWAVPTLYLAPPIWLAAWDTPWVCLRNSTPRPLETTGLCATCPRWEAPADVRTHAARRFD